MPSSVCQTIFIIKRILHNYIITCILAQRYVFYVLMARDIVIATDIVLATQT